jgi:hypothetical protein
MPYLEHYGEGVERRIRRRKRALFCATALLALAGSLAYYFHNYRQESQANRFLERLTVRDYAGAHALWLASDSDRRAYPHRAFLEDWGPESGRDPTGFRIAKSRSCGTGVIVTVELPKGGRERLWVQRDSLVIGFPPPPETLPKICSF